MGITGTVDRASTAYFETSKKRRRVLLSLTNLFARAGEKTQQKGPTVLQLFPQMGIRLLCRISLSRYIPYLRPILVGIRQRYHVHCWGASIATLSRIMPLCALYVHSGRRWCASTLWCTCSELRVLALFTSCCSMLLKHRCNPPHAAMASWSAPKRSAAEEGMSTAPCLCHICVILTPNTLGKIASTSVCFALPVWPLR